MVKFIILVVTSFLVITNATAAVNVYVAPAGWEQSTDSTVQIKEFLADQNNVGKKSTARPSSMVLDNALTAYINQVKKDVNALFTLTELEKYSGTICKISIVTGKTAPTDPTPPEVVTLDFLAENTAPGCKALTKNLEQLVQNGELKKYPVPIKESGLLSIDMIYFFEN